jgi:hypothetical protein
MTRMKQLALGGLAALAIASAAGPAFAEEVGSFQNRLQGATIGLPLGAAPPPGLYTGLESVYLGLANFGNGGGTTGNWSNAFGGHSEGLPAIAQAVPLLYVPGWNFLGATYSMAAVVAFYEASACAQSATGAILFNCQNGLGAQFVFANPTFTPINLSWNLGNGWFVSAGFNFMAPIGSNYSNAAGNTPNPDYWTLEPTLAISYLANNWVLSANFFYDINTASTGPCCLLGAGSANTYNNGNLFYGDFTALYKFGKWEIGPVGYFEVQTTGDSISGPGGAALCATFCGNTSNVAVGGLIGYDFGPVDLQLWVTDIVEAQNAPGGVGAIFIWTRMGFRIWAPEAPKPLVAKN